ncbi:MAG: polyprenyl synthetase family protein [Chloroflexi bacterium]|nr:polyprenyl synthetase family protein [Chloroflexota bacterium]
MNDLKAFSRQWLPQIESYIRGLLSDERPEVRGMYGMMRYHMGWEDERGRPIEASGGKRVRPLVVLMSCQAAGGDPTQALPAAAAVELVHNFSLIHDDIEDNSLTRRHRPTLWSWAGVAQAINAGDAMFTLARLAVLGLRASGIDAERVLAALDAFDRACLHLTEGQYMDIAFETRDEVSVEEYLSMIGGKTAALLAASAQLGAMVATDDADVIALFHRFGRELGLSFQIQDDILGIWGDEALTGKSAAGDILTRKKTWPVLYALSQPGPDAETLAAYYRSDRPLTPTDLPPILELLSRLNARPAAEEAARRHAEAALAALDACAGEPEAVALLQELAKKLLGRRS